MDGTKEGRIEGREGGSRKNDWREGRREGGKDWKEERKEGRRESGRGRKEEGKEESMASGALIHSVCQ